MDFFLGLTISLLFSVCVGVTIVARRFALRVTQFDDALNAICDDMDTFIEYTDDLIKRSTFSRSPDVVAFCNNLRVMRDRMDMHVLASTRETGKDRGGSRNKRVESPNPPVVVD